MTILHIFSIFIIDENMEENKRSDVNKMTSIEDKESIKLDNKILTTKEKINNIDDKLEAAKKKIKKLNDMQDNVNSIAKNMNRCIDLLSKSIRGPQVNGKISEMRKSNKVFLLKSTTSIEEETMKTRKDINELYKEKDTILRESRNQYNKEKEKEEKSKFEVLRESQKPEDDKTEDKEEK